MESSTEFRDTSNASRASPGDGGAIESVTETVRVRYKTGSNDVAKSSKSLWEQLQALPSRYAQPFTLSAPGGRLLSSKEKIGIFYKQLPIAPYLSGFIGIPLPGFLSYPIARVIMPILAIAIPSVPLLVHSIEPESCAAAMYFSAFNLLLWGTAGVAQGAISHAVCAGLATALAINGFNNAQKSFGNDESQLNDAIRISIASSTVGIVVMAVMAYLQRRPHYLPGFGNLLNIPPVWF